MEQPIVVEETFSAAPAEVWRAITDPQQMPRWFFDTICTFEPRVGHESSFVVHAAGTDYGHRWNVLEVEPERRIVYRWRYDDLPGDSTVAWDQHARAAAGSARSALNPRIAIDAEAAGRRRGRQPARSGPGAPRARAVIRSHGLDLTPVRRSSRS